MPSFDRRTNDSFKLHYKIVNFLIFPCSDDQSKCLLTQEGPNKLSSYTMNKNLFTKSRQCKEYLKDQHDPKDKAVVTTFSQIKKLSQIINENFLKEMQTPK